MAVNMIEVYGEPAEVIREAKEEGLMLVETETAFYILFKGDPVLGLSKMMYDVKDALQEFEDFVRC